MESEAGALVNPENADEPTQFAPFTMVITVDVATRTRLGAYWQKRALVETIYGFLSKSQMVHANVSLRPTKKHDVDGTTVFRVTMTVDVLHGINRAAMSFIENGIGVVVDEFEASNRYAVNSDTVRQSERRAMAIASRAAALGSLEMPQAIPA